MNPIQRLFSNTALAFVSATIVKASNTLLFVAIGRLLGPAEAGIFNLGVTFYTVVLALSAWGLHELLVREVATRRAESRRYLIHYLVLRLFLGVIIYGLLLIFLQFNLPYTPYVKMVIRVFALNLFPEAIFMLIQAVFNAHERFVEPAVAAGVISLIKVVGGGWLLWQGEGALAVAWVIVLATTVGVLLLLPGLAKVVGQPGREQFRFRFSFLKTQLAFVSGFVIIGFFTTIDLQLDAFLISFFLTEQDLGWYGAAQTVMLAFWMMPQALRLAIYPLMARYYLENPARLAQFYALMNRYILLVALPMCAGVALLARPVILLIFGEPFAEAIPALQWMIWAVIFSFLTVPNARLMLVFNRQREAGWVTGLSMVTNLILNLWLIPSYGIIGAAIARTVASALFFGAIYGYVQRYLGQPRIGTWWLRPGLATLFMVGCLWQLQNIFFLWTIPAGILLYGLAIYALQAISNEDKHYLEQLLHINKVKP